MPIYSVLANLSTDFVMLAAPLSNYQKTKVNKWHKTAGKPEHNFSDHAMGGLKNPRVSIKLRKPDIVAPKHIVAALAQAGHNEVNYAKGLVKDKYGREVKIGKALIKAGHHDLAKEYAADPQRAANPDHKVVISRHPHDVAGMSTNQGWSSCMDINKIKHHTDYSYKLKDDIKHGTHVAYLVHKDDHKAERPIARIALKPYISEEGHKILRPENKTYGTSNSNFHKTVSAWANKHFPAKDAVYHKHDEVYDDDRAKPIKGAKFASKFQHDVEFASKNKLLASPRLLNATVQKNSNAENIHSIAGGRYANLNRKSLKHALETGILKIPNAKRKLLNEHRDIVIRHERKTTGVKPSKTIPNTFPERDHWYNSLTTKERRAYREKLIRNGVRHTDNVDLNKIK